jgi:Smg protein
MTKESVLNILMYIFDNHMHREKQIDLNDKSLFKELKSVGFHSQSIGRAFRWLYHLSEVSDITPVISDTAFRVFSPYECWVLDVECRNFILALENRGILTPLTRELVIHQTMELTNEGLDISLIKWVTLMVLFNTPGCDDALAQMEFLVQQSDASETHH